MGRKRLYQTVEQLAEANRRKRMKSYWKNQKKEQQKSLSRYYEKNNRSL
jgi:hypothetical protein